MAEVETGVLCYLEPADVVAVVVLNYIPPGVVGGHFSDDAVVELEPAYQRTVVVGGIFAVHDVYGHEVDRFSGVVVVIRVFIICYCFARRDGKCAVLHVHFPFEDGGLQEEVSDVDVSAFAKEVFYHQRLFLAPAVRDVVLVGNGGIVLAGIAAVDLLFEVGDDHLSGSLPRGHLGGRFGDADVRGGSAVKGNGLAVFRPGCHGRGYGAGNQE